jgi:transposase
LPDLPALFAGLTEFSDVDQKRRPESLDCYTLAQWESLEVYLKEPEIEIDNNLVENAIRPTALGKKNWLFFGDADAGQRSAIIYSIIESCRRHHIEPYTYLRDVLTRLPTMTNRQIKDIVPKAWAATRNTAPRAA